VNAFARHPISRIVALAMAVGVLWLVVVTSASAAPVVAKVPSGFVGVNIDGTLADGQPSLPPAMSTMVGTGVESVRVAFNWANAQPTQDGPYEFSQTDVVVGDAARDGLTVLPVVLYTPGWDARPNPTGTIAIPQDDAPYAAYLTALVKRYGPNGTYWADNPTLPKRPIREWQIWNEPNFTFYWPTRPFAPSYVALVKAAHTAIKQADPGAQVRTTPGSTCRRSTTCPTRASTSTSSPSTPTRWSRPT
jgi:hypothetical protein